MAKLANPLAGYADVAPTAEENSARAAYLPRAAQSNRSARVVLYYNDGVPKDLAPLSIALEFARVDQGGDPYAFRIVRQQYLLRSMGGGFESIELGWDQSLLESLKSLCMPSPDPRLLQPARAVFRSAAARRCLRVQRRKQRSHCQPAGKRRASAASRGIEHVIASRYPLSVAGSIGMTEALYGKLLSESGTIEEAVLAARHQLIRESPYADWACLQFFARAKDESSASNTAATRMVFRA